MTGMSQLLDDGMFLSLPLDTTIVYALFYSTLFWLPVRGAAAMIDYWKSGEDMVPEMLAEPEPCGYRVGMKVLPPL